MICSVKVMETFFSQNWNHMYQIGERLDWKLSPLHSKCVVKKILSVSFYVRTAINREFLPFMWSVCSLFWHSDINSLQISVVAANILELLLWSLCLELMPLSCFSLWKIVVPSLTSWSWFPFTEHSPDLNSDCTSSSLGADGVVPKPDA